MNRSNVNPRFVNIWHIPNPAQIWRKPNSSRTIYVEAIYTSMSGILHFKQDKLEAIITDITFVVGDSEALTIDIDMGLIAKYQ